MRCIDYMDKPVVEAWLEDAEAVRNRLLDARQTVASADAAVQSTLANLRVAYVNDQPPLDTPWYALGKAHAEAWFEFTRASELARWLTSEYDVIVSEAAYMMARPVPADADDAILRRIRAVWITDYSREPRWASMT